MSVPVDFLSPEQKQLFFQRCNAEACQNAVARLTNARNAFPVICNESAAWSSLRTWYTATAATAFAAAGAAAAGAAIATASIIGIPLATILWVAAAVFLATALLLTGLAINAGVQYGRAQDDLHKAQAEFNAALADATTTCGPYCSIGDQKMPTC